MLDLDPGPYVCSACGRIADGEMCMACGRNRPALYPPGPSPGSYSAILGMPRYFPTGPIYAWFWVVIALFFMRGTTGRTVYVPVYETHDSAPEPDFHRPRELQDDLKAPEPDDGKTMLKKEGGRPLSPT